MINSIISKIYSKVGIKSKRTKNITKHVGLSFLFRFGSIACSFLLVPLTINYLDTQNYGLWLTLSSFISWFAFFDIGLGNGLRNKFSEAKALGNDSLVQGYVSTAYFTLGLISLVLIIFFLIVNVFVDWTVIFNADKILGKDLSILMPIVFSFFCIQMVVKLITTIYVADQKPSVRSNIGFLIQALSLFFVWVLTQLDKSSLLLFGAIYSALPVLILLIFNLKAFSSKYKLYKPKISFFKKEYLNDIFGLGIKFFFLQISVMILFSTDNLIISNIFSPEKVVPYNIAYKYFGITNMIFGIILTPYWSAFSEAFVKKDFLWIKKSIINLNKIFYGIVLLTIILFLISSFIYKIWIGDKVFIPLKLSFFMAVYFIQYNFYLPYNMFVNGAGKVQTQLYSLVFAALINIPLSIFFAKYMNFGSTGVIIATSVCLLPQAIMLPIQYGKIINNRAFGIWNK